MRKATGAKVMALGDDAAALSSGTDRSALGDAGWEPVKVDRVFKDGDTPNAGVKLIGNTKSPALVDDTLRSFRIQETLKPGIYLPMHPESYFAGKVERIKAGESPHPLFDPNAYTKLIADTETVFQKRLHAERAGSSPAK